MGIGQCDYILVLASYSIALRTWLLLTLRFHPISFLPVFDSTEDNFYLAKLSFARCYSARILFLFRIFLHSIGISWKCVSMWRKMKMNFDRIFMNIDNWPCIVNIENRVNCLYSTFSVFIFVSFCFFFKFVVWLIYK